MLYATDNLDLSKPFKSHCSVCNMNIATKTKEFFNNAVDHHVKFCNNKKIQHFK